MTSSTFKILPFELGSLSDVARLACALEKIPKPVFAIRSGGGYMVGVTAEWIEGHIVFFYYREDGSSLGEYLCYKLNGGTEFEYYSERAEKLPAVCSPIIKLKNIPKGVFAESSTARDKITLTLIEVEDAQSLIKMGLYRLVLDESPAPILYVPAKENPGVLGSFVRASEDDKSVLFLYHISDEPPASFIKVDPNVAGKMEYTMRVEEPGYIYAKLAKLKKPEGLLLPG